MRLVNRPGHVGRVFGIGTAGSAGLFALSADPAHRPMAMVLMIAIVAFGIVAVVFSLIGLRRNPRSDAVTGVVLGLFGLAFLFATVIVGPRTVPTERNLDGAACSIDAPGSPAWHLDGCR
jgi:F0F1-type ATP synthase membrane subunit c/vacuolar-type H+-ATPase subunit K